MFDVFEICVRLGDMTQQGDSDPLQEILERYDIDINSEEFNEQVHNIEKVAELTGVRPTTLFLAGFIGGLEYATIFNQMRELNLED